MVAHGVTNPTVYSYIYKRPEGWPNDKIDFTLPQRVFTLCKEAGMSGGRVC